MIHSLLLINISITGQGRERRIRIWRLSWYKLFLVPRELRLGYPPFWLKSLIRGLGLIWHPPSSPFVLSHYWPAHQNFYLLYSRRKSLFEIALTRFKIWQILLISFFLEFHILLIKSTLNFLDPNLWQYENRSYFYHIIFICCDRVRRNSIVEVQKRKHLEHGDIEEN